MMAMPPPVCLRSLLGKREFRSLTTSTASAISSPQQGVKRKRSDPTRLLIVGLGNPGGKFERTRHNVGFRAIKYFAETILPQMLSEDQKFQTSAIKWGKMTRVNADILQVAKNSYIRAPEAKKARHLLLSMLDDADVTFGSCKFKAKGGSTQNGVHDIISKLSTTDIPRLRIGVSRSSGQKDLAGHVLSPFNRREEERMPKLLALVGEIIRVFIHRGPDAASRVANSQNLDNMDKKQKNLTATPPKHEAGK